MRQPDPRLDGIPTPALVYDLDKLRAAALRLRALAESAGGIACYSVKANREAEVLRELAAAGFCADVASEAELDAAVNAGMPIFSATSPGWSGKALARLDAAGATIYFDHEPQIAAARQAGLRLEKHGARVSMPGDYRHFGFEWPDAAATLRQRFGCHFRRFHFHCGEIGDCDSLARRLARIETLLAGCEVEEINFGGGYGVLSNRADELEAAFELFGDFGQRIGARLVFEFGKAAVARCGVLLASVLAVKRRAGLQFAVVDCSAFNLGEWEPRQLWACDRAEPWSQPTRIVGPSCYEGDLFAATSPAPPLQVGDRLVFAPMGAYAASIAASLHGLPQPASFFLPRAVAAASTGILHATPTT
ncbi:diaminopimelate decarboxylase family protein [Pseudogulbenkiania ferrooxidans]|uniref:Orn/DAP/Arg decarboxylase 2 C-terminal domain-containing protein n=1 Tax=Pseudogulbenkiania ferrooxidans EGD-HP2 TaxID=1388764 RepID=A0ABN0N2Y5_9NEIS|nr:hypothetical protein [Pseudogulbenkiania ferrooxidans]ERE00371.1 hypothetical protein O166_14670 [Pseudogulbenkiania ferrooxidans EGD-HP2]